jgi:molecular chaperone GrpE
MKDKEQLDQEKNQNDTPVNEEITEVNLEELVKEAGGADNLNPVENSLEEEFLELKNKYLRLYSDFENYRKRTSKERLDLITTASEDVLKDLIPVVDDFERSLKASESEAITQIPAPSEKLKGKVVDVVEKGYKLGDKVVRFAKVVTGA